MAALNTNYSSTGAANQGKLDLDNASQGTLTQFLQQNDPEHLASTGGGAQKYAAASRGHSESPRQGPGRYL